MIGGARARRVGLALASLLVSAAAAEAALRAFLPRGWFVWPPGFARTAEPSASLPGIEGPSQLTINALGMRGDAWTGRERYRLLAVGGSTTICVELDDREVWTQLVQQRLEAVLGAGAVRVGNVGRPGHGTTQHVLQVEKLLRQHPGIDAVLVLAGINDMLFHLRRTLVPPGDKPFVPASPDVQMRQTFSVVPAWDEDAPWYRRVALARVLAPWRAAPPPVPGPVMDPQFDFLADARALRRRARHWRDALPDLQSALADYTRRLGQIASLARAAEVRPIFLTQPTLWRADLGPTELDRLWMGGPPFDAVPEAPEALEFFTPRALAEGMQLYNDAMLRACASLGVECFDVAGELPRDAGLFVDDAHFSELGSRRLAEVVAARLLESDPLRRLAGAGR